MYSANVGLCLNEFGHVCFCVKQMIGTGGAKVPKLLLRLCVKNELLRMVLICSIRHWCLCRQLCSQISTYFTLMVVTTHNLNINCISGLAIVKIKGFFSILTPKLWGQGTIWYGSVIKRGHRGWQTTSLGKLGVGFSLERMCSPCFSPPQGPEMCAPAVTEAKEHINSMKKTPSSLNFFQNFVY